MFLAAWFVLSSTGQLFLAGDVRDAIKFSPHIIRGSIVKILRKEREKESEREEEGRARVIIYSTSSRESRCKRGRYDETPSPERVEKMSSGRKRRLFLAPFVSRESASYEIVANFSSFRTVLFHTFHGGGEKKKGGILSVGSPD